ncbi:MAG: DUF4783 domain-containing protein [Bacteroidetes bacterium]|nr:DUF4783 domain-containing protein [Bacteroidota bacterium]
MKKIIIILLTVFSVFQVQAQSEEQSKVIFENVGKAFRDGDASQLGLYFASSLDVILPGNEGTYSKQQAEMILKDFFSKNRPKSFVINHLGTSNDGSRYAIGTCRTANQNYRAYILIKNGGGKFVIRQLQLEKD